MSGLQPIAPAYSATSYEELADALIGVSTYSEEHTTSNPVELNLDQKVRSVLSGEFPVDSLPIFPATANALIPRLNDPQLNLERIYPFLVQDPAISAEIIRFANDGILGQSSKTITNLDQAMVAMDREALHSLLLKVLLRPSIPIKTIYYNLIGKPLWEHARDCSHACRRLAYDHQVAEPDAALLGLIHDIGKLVIFKLLCSALKTSGTRSSPRAATVAQLVRQYGLRLSAFVAERWNFPQVSVTALHEQEDKCDPDHMTALGRTLYYGHLIAEANLVLQKHMYQGPVIERALQKFGLSLNRVYDIFPATPRLAYR